MNSRVMVTAALVFAGLGPSIAAEPEGLKSPKILYMSLNDYVDLSLKQGERALVARNNFENANLFYKVAYRQTRLPTVSLDADMSRQKNEINSLQSRTEDASGAITLSQPLYVTGSRLSASYFQSSERFETAFGTVTHSFTRPYYSFTFSQPLYLFVGNSDWRSWKQSQLGFDISSDNYQSEILSIENRARALYFFVLLKKAQLEVEKSKSESSRRANKVTQILVEGGKLAEIEHDRSEIRFKLDGRRVQNAETALAQAVNDLREFASLKIDMPLELTSTMEYMPIEHSVESLITFALNHRPDYFAARRELELAELDVKEALEENNPTLDAFASLSRSDLGASFLPDTETEDLSVGVNMRWLLFDSRQTHLKAEAARNSLENERVAFRSLERNIRKEISNAFLEVKGNETQMDDLKISQQQGRRNVEAVRIRYQNGRDRLLDVFDSEQSLRDLELEYFNVLVSANLAKDRLALLVGAPLSEVPK